MAGPPRIDVLIPVYNAAATLDTALDSLRRQRGVHCRVIAVNDGSADRSGIILDTWASRWPGFRVLHLPHRGLTAALNAGLEWVETPWFARMDADDIARPGRLAAQLALAQESGAGITGTGVRIFPRHTGNEGMSRYESWVNGITTPEALCGALLWESPLPHPTWLAATAVIRGAGGYRDFDGPEDYDLLHRLAVRGVRFAKVPRKLVLWRDTPVRATRTDGRYRPEALMAVRARAVRDLLLGGGTRYVLWGMGPTGKALCGALAALGVFPERVIDVDPRKIGQRYMGVIVEPPSALAAARPRTPIAVSVAGGEARAQIREFLARHGFAGGRDYGFCA